jgi:transposase
MRFCGIDLHSNNSFIVIIDEQDRVLYNQRLANNLSAILEALSAYREELSGIAIESTFNWYWLVDGLQEQGYRVHLVNTTAVKQYEGLKHRGDESDAKHLAHLLRLGLLPEGHIMPKVKRAVRDLARKRMSLVQQRSVQILSIESAMQRYMGSRVNSNTIKRLTSDDLAQLPLQASEILSLQSNLAIMQALQNQIDCIEQELARYCRNESDYRLLKSTTGIGDVLATVILLETGDIDRFASVGNYVSYCRCVGSAYLSNGKKKGVGNTKNGNRYLAWAYVEAANFAVRYSEQAKKFYQKKKAKRNSIVAIKAVAHKLARACYHMLKTGEAFSVERCFT